MSEHAAVIERIRRLVAIPSVSSTDPAHDQGNRGVVALLAQWLDELGMAVELMPLPHHPDKLNLVATAGAGEGGLVLAGHTDTVPWDEGRWSSDPFRLELRDGRAYGLGTSDMKAFFALVVGALEGIGLERLRAPVTVVATADEESTMAGARALLRLGRPRARCAVVGEPTGLRPVYAHKGILMEAVEVVGRSGHSSDPALGANAIEGMHAVIGALLALRAELAEAHRDPAFRVAHPTLNLGRIEGGDSPNRICPRCELHFDLRLLPGMAVETLRETIRRRAEAALAGSGLSLRMRPLIEGAPAHRVDPASALVREAEALTGRRACTVGFATEAPFYAALGMETLVLGPGEIDQAHQPDEYLELAQIGPAVALLQRLIARHCT
ncbi:acetylornithine deacetylase [Inmirania thermothiophila]|uniref:Acetylornithine deacetylase n=1 Tax=Inmirania thermothiophila TaxID=1750597 RepID=A0A3N1Y874_9GAMM|nr:acetylornithine deacetylase [Inmirania thermothiophila]ROR35019.1 acetylornithine deacetylase [Inmirania thermothiophila]